MQGSLAPPPRQLYQRTRLRHSPLYYGQLPSLPSSVLTVSMIVRYLPLDVRDLKD